MTNQATTAPPISRLRCIQCGAVRDTATQDFRCPECGDLLEAYFPGWVTSSGPLAVADQRADGVGRYRDDRAVVLFPLAD